MRSDTKMDVRVKAPAKVNLTFDVTGTLPDNYHSIVSIFQAVSLEDFLTFKVFEDSSQDCAITIDAEFVGHPGSFPLDQNNLIARAARAFHAKTNSLAGKSLAVFVEKQIPIGAGLAGGSSNAAATFIGLNSLFGAPLSNAELRELAVQIGADVPFLIDGGTQLGQGKGEILKPLDITEKLTLVIVKPRNLSISTPSVFRDYDMRLQTDSSDWRPKQNHDLAISGLREGAIEIATESFGNVFEPIVFANHPTLGLIKEYLLGMDCWCAQLSGSGPSIFAVVSNLDMAHFVRRKLKEAETRGVAPWSKEDGWEVDCYFAESVPYGAIVDAESGK